ncbi:MAG TPA: ATP-binding protein [Burkholderiales bacterium]|nr:ATP-binding protein [Burkholderiales bacterium]
MLESFGPSPVTAGSAAFRATLEREYDRPVDVHHATVDAARFADPAHEAQLVDFLKSRYQGKLDLVAPMLSPAAEFMSRHPDLFGDTPVVVAGISLRRIPPGLDTPATTYVAARGDPAGHIENVLRLLPDTRRIVMVFGASKFERFSSALARKQFQQFAGRVDFDWLEGLSMDETSARVAALSQGSVVVLANLVADGTGLALDKDEGVRRLYAVAKVPIFGYFESSLGKGIVGGRLYPDVTLGVEGARLAIRILKGEASNKITPVVLEENAPVYDWRELHRFGIPEDRLPPGSEVRYRQLTVWEAYRWHIAAAIALLLLQAVLISGLILQAARRRRLEAERKRTEAELLHTRAELAHMTRVFTLGELSASLAHELNQPLTAILSNAQAAQRFISAGGVTDLQEVSEILGDIVEDNKRAGEVIRRVRSLVKKEGLDAEPLDMARAVREVVLLLHSDAVLRNVSVSLEAEPALPAVLGDRIQLQQVTLNLLLNAFDAVKESNASERAVVLKVEPDGKDMLKVAVSDSGHGLAGDCVDQVFDAFYTTKPNGLGMGLSISRSIVEAHRGRLWAENNPGRGTTFFFTVPVAPQ